MIKKENFTAWHAEQNYHRGPKLPLAENNNQSKYDHLKKTGYYSLRFCASKRNKEL
jgi:hypothetical protein